MKSLALVPMVAWMALLPCACLDTTSESDDCKLQENCPVAPIDERCVPTEVDGVVRDDCGIFVSSSLGDDANAGTKEAPMATLGAAIAAAGSKFVYACNETFEEAVTLPSGMTVFGGLNCATDWAWADANTTLTAADGAIPLTFASGSRVARVEDFEIVSADAAVPGGSSIAVMVDSAAAELVRCLVLAGDGAAGADGLPHDADPSLAGPMGLAGVNCNGVGSTGGESGVNTCGGDVVSGGQGGNGSNVAVGGDGNDGSAKMGIGGVGGEGEPAANCTGGEGMAGMHGIPGVGAGSEDIGTLSVAGFVGVPGEDGRSAGEPGEGGGGGGGANMCSQGFGASGGGGGAGGCGGMPGRGGGAGGGSFAIVSINGTLTLMQTELRPGVGGAGGQGSEGQLGGMGGAGGNFGGAGACTGGRGGDGGQGGSGAGGRGGPSVAIAYMGEEEPVQQEVVFQPGTAGIGGATTGTGSNTGSEGAAGLQRDLMKFE